MSDDLRSVLDDLRVTPPLGDRMPTPQLGDVGADLAPQTTDLGNARLLVRAHGADLRYVPEWGRWLCWDGCRWGVDVTGEVHRRAKEVAEDILDQARIDHDQALFRHGIKSQSATALAAMVRVAATEPGIPVLVDQLDAHPWLLSVANGTLDLRTGALGPHDREDLLTKCSTVSWDPAAECPKFEEFLARILPNVEVRQYVQRLTGYSLTGDVSEQILAILYGTGANGKSTFKELVLSLVGDHGKPASPKLLLATKHDEHPTAIADLHGRRLVVSHEVEDGVRLDEPLVKELTGGDRLKARFMRQDFWDFTPTHKLWLLTNHKPRIRGTDNGIWRRIALIPFEVTIPANEQDRHLLDRLRSELPGILRWAVAGCLAWQRDGLRPPAAVLAATEAYRTENDLVAQFLADRCHEDETCQVRSTHLYCAYTTWCTDNGLTHPLSQKALTGRLTEKGFDQTKNRQKQAVFLGLGLADQVGGHLDRPVP